MTDCVKPGIDERYLVAGNASDLSVRTEQSGPVDLLIAAGWSQSRLGSAALRLHSEWSAAAPPRRPDRELIDHIASKLPRRNGKPDRAAAQAEAVRWYAAELRRIHAGLHSLVGVREQLVVQALRRGVESPERLAAAVLHHWLDPVCPACHGRKFASVKGTAALSARACPSCHGSGSTEPPGGQDGRWLLNFLDDCVFVARSSIRKRLRTVQKMV